MLSLFIALCKAASSYQVRHFTRALLVALLSGGVFAQATIAADDSKTWGGIGWGLGVASDFDIGGKRIVDAQIVNGITRVTNSSSNVGVGFVLEAHYFFKDWILPSVKGGSCSPSSTSPYRFPCTDVATGPFVAIEVGGGTKATTDAGPITAYALGWMVGLQHRDSTNPNNNTSSWNFGIGLRVDPQAKVLGDGFIPNLPPPAGETAIRTTMQPRLSLMLLSSFSF